MNSTGKIESEVLENTLLNVVRTLHPRRKSQVLDFARWLQTQSASAEFSDEELLDDEVSEAELEAEERAWDAAYLANKEQFRAMAHQALDDLDADETADMIAENRLLR